MNLDTSIAVQCELLNQEALVKVSSVDVVKTSVEDDIITVNGCVQEIEREHRASADMDDDKTVRVSVDPMFYMGRKIPTYDGEYVVTPIKTDAIILDTKDKRMTDDVTVKKIPYFETTNDYGTTIYIGSEI